MRYGTLVLITILFLCGERGMAQLPDRLTKLSLSPQYNDTVRKVWKGIYEPRQVDGELQKGAFQQGDIHRFDRQGNLLEVVLLNEDRATERKFAYQYNEDGQRTAVRRYGPDTTLFQRKLVTYNEHGDRISETSCLKGQQERKKRYQHRYNEQGRVTATLILSGQQDIARKTYQYNDRGLLMTKRLMREDQAVRKMTYGYNEDGRPISRDIYYNDTIVEKIRLRWSSRGKLTRLTRHNIRENLKRKIYFNEDERLTLIKRYEQGTLTLRKKRQYNDYGFVERVETVRFTIRNNQKRPTGNDSPRITTRQYEYGSNGNPRQKVVISEKGEPVSLSVYRITYY